MTFRGAAAVMLAGFLAGGCATGLHTVPYVAADAEPLPTRCPTVACPQPSSTHQPSQPPEPEPTGTATGGGGGGPRPQKSKTPKPGTQPSTGPTIPGVGPFVGGPTPPAGGKFTAFSFDLTHPYEPAFPIDPPPPPPPIQTRVPPGLVAVASVLAAGVAATARIASRRTTSVVV